MQTYPEEDYYDKIIGMFSIEALQEIIMRYESFC